ncbi:ORF6N domain-containing protein [Bordetella bronchialis]|uniref:KilA-N DNA-binding domain-containing protein n=1 Tax=Bordetella bronchialis TaxID=463025 RepID=A0A193FUX3_9BORD|nr:ORF6N domain-containing protein [Bordetella bronchialis]ANN71557.1 hypothetical protein BAU08_09585 [Bordetella bronchialis]
MSKVQAVSAESLPVVQWQGEKVITTEYLARVYGTEANNLQANFTRNKARFIEGKHFFRASGKDLENLRLTIGKSQISAKTRSLILWTERGAARHAKMLETDRAWEVFETLEDCYFAQREKAKQEADRSTVWDRYPLYGFTIDTVLRHHLLFSKVYMLLNLFAGSRRFKDMTKQQVSEVIEFADRFAIGQDTRSDWQRIQDNQMLLFGEPRQKDLVQMLLTAR